MYELYALIDPKDSKIRYIGYTSNSKNRLREHINTSIKTRNKISHKSNWIRSLKDNNLEPIYKTLIKTTSLESIKQLEIDYIFYYKDKYNLVNGTKGGDGVNGLKWSDESRAKIKGRIIPRKQYKVELTNIKDNNIVILDNKEEAASFIGCKISTIRGHHSRPVYGWLIKSIEVK